MNSYQVEFHAREEKLAEEKNKGKKDKGRKHGGKDGAVPGDINDGAKKPTK